jgi:hypothetical protein
MSQSPTSRYIEELAERRIRDARRFEEMEDDLCMLCGAEGPDKRSLWISYFYAIHEVLPEAIDLHGVADEAIASRGYVLRSCKECRGKFLSYLALWRQHCLNMRDVPKDEDGEPLGPLEPGRDIPVRVNGRTVYMTEAEWREGYGADGREPYRIERDDL